MQQFQSLKRLLFFYTLTLLVMLTLYYAMLFGERQDRSEYRSIQIFEWLQHEVAEHGTPTNRGIESILQQPFFEDISYQLVFMLPSGQTYVHQQARTEEDRFATIAFPAPAYLADSGAYRLSRHNLAGVINLASGHKLYVVLQHRAPTIDWVSYQFWLPLMAALGLFMLALLYMLKRHTHWEQLLLYTENLTTSAKDAYTPPPFISSDATPEFLRLGHALSRVNFKLHNNYRRIKTLSNRLERLVDQAPLPMLMLMRKGEISFFNQRFEQVFATAFTRDANYHLTDFVIGSDKATQQLLHRLSAQRVTRTLSVIGLENKQAYQLHLTPWFGEHGQVHGFTVLLNNVENFATQSKILQRQNKQLQRQIKELDRLRSTIGHELRTPLNAIIGTLDLIDASRLTTKEQEVLHTLNQSSQSMLTMLNDMLDMAKIEAGKAQIVNEPTDIYKVGQHISDLMIGHAQRKKIELHYLFMPDCPRYIHTDANRLQQILLNLMDNAIKFTQSGHVVLLIEPMTQTPAFFKVNRSLLHYEPLHRDSSSRSSNLNSINPLTYDHHSTLPQHQWIRFRVIDTGIGITQAEQRQLFSYFNQANATIHRSFGGTGLGLAISNSFAKLLDGFIEIDSDGVSGSTFTLTLPCRAPAYLSMYHARSHISSIQMIALINLPIYAQYLDTLCQHIHLSADIYHNNNLPSAAQICTDIAALPPQRVPILLLDYDYYADNPNTAQDFETLLSQPAVPKILISMRSERSIPTALFDRIDGFLNKPVDTTLLLSELIRLTRYSSIKNPPALDHQTTKAAKQPYDQSKKTSQLSSIIEPKIDSRIQNQTDKNTDDSAQNNQDDNALILVVEDNPTNQKIINKLLGKLGYQCIIAENGEQALQRLDTQRSQIALILMDCRMPVMDGFEATRTIRAQGDDIPIIALTANASDDDKQACQDAGMTAFLSKPVKKDALKTQLELYISAQDSADPK